MLALLLLPTFMSTHYSAAAVGFASTSKRSGERLPQMIHLLPSSSYVRVVCGFRAGFGFGGFQELVLDSEELEQRSRRIFRIKVQKSPSRI